jgi:hypothetical protein
VIYISTAHGIKIETRKYKKVIKTKNHEESAAGRQIQANRKEFSTGSQQLQHTTTEW